MNARDKEQPCTPPRLTGNGGAGCSETVGQIDSHEDSDDELQDDKKKQKRNGRIEFTLIKQWVTGENANMDSEDIEQEFFELAPLHVIGCLSPSLRSFPTISQTQPMMFCGNSILSTKMKKGSKLIL
jgi:hypothetical protein